MNKKDVAYYKRSKARIIPYFKKGPNKILEIGCASGKLGSLLRKNGRAKLLVGVELNEAAANQAKNIFDKVYVGDFENMEIEDERDFDYVLCGDVLEHLKNPWAAVKKINNLLKPGGQLIAISPNIRFWEILFDLAVMGNWEYQSAGILDDTHLRFFTKKTFVKMFLECGMDIKKKEMVIPGKKKKFFNKVTFNILEEFLGYQIMVIAQKRKV